MSELKLMKGNEALAEAAIRAGADAYYGYPITPQSEVMEYLMLANPINTTGMVVLQAESEVASINMVYGAAAAGKMALTSSSSPGISLMQEGISYMAGAEIPGVVVNVVRGGPGLGTIQPSQADYFQSVKGGGHGDYKLIVLAPASVQEMADYMKLAFDLAFKYRNPTLILSDGAIGQMMEKVEMFDPIPRRTDEEIYAQCPWATTGRPKGKDHRVLTSLRLVASIQEDFNKKLQKKYKEIEENEVRCEMLNCDDAECVIVAYGSSARTSMKAVEMARKEGLKLGILRPQTLWPFPTKQIQGLIEKGNVKGFLSVEMSAGQMVEDVKLAANCKVPVSHFGRMGGVIAAPAEILEAAKNFMKNI